jgi:signal peptidase I
MMPNFHDGDYLIVNEIGYHMEKPQRGDVIIFKYPNDPSQYFIKRVIGLPGEKIEIRDNKITIYNSEKPQGFVLDESAYLASSVITSGDISEQLGDGQYYVLGDNRPNSSDSRRWGILDQKFIIGKAWVRAWPFDDFKVFEGLKYNS